MARVVLDLYYSAMKEYEISEDTSRFLLENCDDYDKSFVGIDAQIT